MFIAKKLGDGSKQNLVMDFEIFQAETMLFTGKILWHLVDLLNGVSQKRPILPDQPTKLFCFQRRCFNEPVLNSMHLTKSQFHQHQQFLQSFWMQHMGFFNPKSTTFQTSKKVSTLFGYLSGWYRTCCLMSCRTISSDFLVISSKSGNLLLSFTWNSTVAQPIISDWLEQTVSPSLINLESFSMTSSNLSTDRAFGVIDFLTTWFGKDLPVRIGILASTSQSGQKMLIVKVTQSKDVWKGTIWGLFKLSFFILAPLSGKRNIIVFFS